MTLSASKAPSGNPPEAEVRSLNYTQLELGLKSLLADFEAANTLEQPEADSLRKEGLLRISKLVQAYENQAKNHVQAVEERLAALESTSRRMKLFGDGYFIWSIGLLLGGVAWGIVWQFAEFDTYSFGGVLPSWP